MRGLEKREVEVEGNVTRRLGYYDEDGMWHRTEIEVKCSCGNKIDCYYFTNTCPCGKEYNNSGQELRPRDEWEESWDGDY